MISDTGLGSSIRFFMGNREPQFAVTRLQFHVAEKFYQGVQFILFSQTIIQYKNTYRNCKVARESSRNQRAYEAWAPQSQRNISKI